MDDCGSPVLARLIEARPDAVSATHARLAEATAIVARDTIVDVARFLRDDRELDFDMLSDLTAVDHLHRGRGAGRADPSGAAETARHPAWGRFEVVYHLYSSGRGHRLRVKVRLTEDDCELDSLCDVWRAANWMEREVYDMYGIRFRRHPNLTRILLYDEFEGHPLRKDYPKTRRQPLIGPHN
jgi:NADH-quinone oxidoreductase subunit C